MIRHVRNFFPKSIPAKFKKIEKYFLSYHADNQLETCALNNENVLIILNQTCLIYILNGMQMESTCIHTTFNYIIVR